MKIIYQKEKNKNKEIAEVSFLEQDFDEVIKETGGQKNIGIGIKKKNDVNKRRFINFLRKSVALAKVNHIEKLQINLSELKFKNFDFEEQELAELVAVAFEMANYEFLGYKSEREVKPVKEFYIYGGGKSLSKSLKNGQIIGRAVNVSRDLANTPANDLTPEILRKKAKALLKNSFVTVKSFNQDQLKQMKMNGILSVGKGSVQKPEMIVLTYKGARERNRKPIVLVGKAVTFDSGGADLKPSDSMSDMYMDMAGGASVIAVLKAASELKLKRNIIAVIPAVENMMSGSGYRPGDILKMANGKTVEVGNTDAEGRIILADALHYAKKFKPELVIDVATLTGAALAALGYRASAVFSSDEIKLKKLTESGEKTGDYVWPMPLWQEFESEIKGINADYSNIGKHQKVGGVNTAAAFLYQFIKGWPWVHIDIAPRMSSVDDEYLAKGAAGPAVRLILEFIRSN